MTAKEILTRIANFLFTEWCAAYDDALLNKHYAELLDQAHAALDEYEKTDLENKKIIR